MGMMWAEVKHALNSTLGTARFASLDQILINLLQGKEYIFDTPGS